MGAVIAVGFLCLLGRALPAAAPPAETAPAAEAAGESEPADTKADKSSSLGPIHEAQARFSAGVALYEKKELKGALAAFKAAYAIDPVYRVLYNLGLVSYEIKDWAGALNHYRAYLEDDRVPTGRRVQVERVVLELAQRVTHLEIEVRDGPAEVQVDDEPVALSRLGAPVAVNPGTHRVRVTYAKQAPQVRTIVGAGADRKHLVFERAVARPPRTTAIADEFDEDQFDEDELEAEGLSRRSSRRSESRASRLPTYTWIATGTLLASASVVGYLAWQSSNQLVADRMRYPVDGAKLANERTRTQMLSTVTDGLLLGSALFAVVSAYLTWGHDDSGKDGQASASAGTGPHATALQPMPAGSVSLSQMWRF